VTGWTLSVAAAGLSLVNMVVVLSLLLGAGREFELRRGIAPPAFPDSVVMCVVSGVLAFLLFAGLAIVFARAMRSDPPVLVLCMVGGVVGALVAVGLSNSDRGLVTLTLAGIGFAFGAFCEVVAFSDVSKRK
jgi:hypothetical protein